jgi:hypothetical protein
MITILRIIRKVIATRTTRNGRRAHVERLVVDAHALGLLDALAAVRALHRVLDVHELRTTTGGAPPAALTRRSRGTHATLTRRSRGTHAEGFD